MPKPDEPLDVEALRAIVPGRIETFEFPNVDQVDATEQRQGGVKVIAESVRQNNELWEVRIRIAFGEVAGALESHRGWIYKNECYLKDPEGERIEYAGFETTRQISWKRALRPRAAARS